MNPLKNLETMLANLVEGTFGRVFRSEVRPMELARRLTREMDAHRTQSVSRVYVPNEYAVWLSPEDRALYEGVEHELIDELCAYLLEHARRENLMLAAPPQIVFHTDERLTLGEFGIEAHTGRAQEQVLSDSVPEGHGQEARRARGSAQGGVEHDQDAPRSVSEEWLEPAAGPAAPAPAPSRAPAPAPSRAPAPEPAAPPPSAPEPAKRGETMIYSSSQRIGGALLQARARRPSRAVLVIGGRRVLVPPPGAVLGRSRECDIVLDDAGVSRRHAEIRPTEEEWVLADLGSTNGVRINGRALRGRQPLQLGDRIELGNTELVFEVR
jgi:FhaA, N-terminal domain/FHA domain